ncbi:MAG TPA: FG-GAP-like repeat-containing protein [Chryseolinea sp.]
MLKTVTAGWLFLALLATSVWSYGQSFVLTSDNLVPAHNAHTEWADLDNDGDLDIIYLGFTDETLGYATKVYENVNGSFTSKNTALPNIRNGGFALGDYDKDGDLDILLGGLSPTGYISVLYENKGAFSFSLKESYPGLSNTTFTWFDIDNDEDLDFLFGGMDDHTGGPDPFVNKIFVYENTGGVFNQLSTTTLTGTSQCSMDWADSNGDGKIDLLVTGPGVGYVANTAIYLNDGNKKFVKDTKSSLRQTVNGDVKWGDFDNDGDMDAFVAGSQPRGGTTLAVVYENIDGVLKERTDIPLAAVGETWFGGSKWVDYNNDGLLDILISGQGDSFATVVFVFELYKNKGNGTFEKVEEPFFTGLVHSSVDFGDFDNDGDADICFTGINPAGLTAGIYENRLLDGPTVVNTNPSPPAVAGFSERFFRKQVTLAWQDGSDQQTPSAALSYNFYLRNGVQKFTSPTSNFATGYLLTTNPANGRAKRAIVNGIPEGNNYWAVQSIDGAKSGSLFSGEKTFYQINGPEAKTAEIITPTSVKLTWVDNSSIETSYQVVRSTSPTTGFTSPVALAQNTVSYTDNFAFLAETYYYYRIYAANATKASGYDSLKVLIPSAPTGLLAQSVNASKISLAWNDNTAYESGYEVERKLSSGGSFAKVATLAAGAKSYTDTGLSEGTSYDYRVRAILEYGASVYTNISNAQTNFRPLSNDLEKETSEDNAISFSAQEFVSAFSDPDPSDELVAIVIATLPQKGILKLNNSAVATGQSISRATLDNLQFIPNPNENGSTTLTFFNNDGKDNSLNSYAVKLNIVPVNDPPDFSIPATINLAEDFAPQLKMRPQPGAIPQDELSQVVTYSIQPETSDIVTMSFKSTTGELTLASLPDKFGDVEFTITVTDGQAENNTVSKAVKLTVASVNDAPVLSIIADQKIEYGNAIPPISFTVTDVDNPVASIVLSAFSDNQALVKNDKITIQGATGERSIQISPEGNRLGDAAITLSAGDGVATTTVKFKVNIFSITAISESMSRVVKIFPNPFTSSLQVNVEGSFEQAHKLVLYDPLGRETSSILLTESESTVNFEQVHDGVYILNIVGVNGDILFRERVVKN